MDGGFAAVLAAAGELDLVFPLGAVELGDHRLRGLRQERIRGTNACARIVPRRPAWPLPPPDSTTKPAVIADSSKWNPSVVPVSIPSCESGVIRATSCTKRLSGGKVARADHSRCSERRWIVDLKLRRAFSREQLLAAHHGHLQVQRIERPDG
jgi:hypothetical protein